MSRPKQQQVDPLAAVQNGDRIRLSIAEKRIDLLVDEAQIAARLAKVKPIAQPDRGYRALYARTVMQAPDGCDFDFLVASDSGEGT